MNHTAPIQFHLPSRIYSVQINHSNLYNKSLKSDDDVVGKDNTIVTPANTFTYTLRGLRPQEESDDNINNSNHHNAVDTTLNAGCQTELEQWTTFCEHVFSYKQPNPPTKEYFLRHYTNDPYKDLSHIRIATIKTTTEGCQGTDTNEIIVASCRIFHRYISFPDLIRATTTRTKVSSIAAGGIGEVCTIDTHRYRGLSKELLMDAINCMKQQSLYTVSFLHSASTFFPVYQKVGYHNIVSNWSVISIDHTTLLQFATTMYASEEIDAKDYTMRIAQFPDDTDQLFLLHQVYTEQRYIGCIIRSIEYWNQYIASELHNTLYVIEKIEEGSNDINNHNVSTTVTNKKLIVGWMSLRYREQQERYQLREFGCCLNRSMAEVQYIFQQLLTHCYQKAEEQKKSLCGSGMDDNNAPTWKLHLPTSVLREMTKNSNNNSNINRCILDTCTENDHGWMYKVLFQTNNNSDDTEDDISWLDEVAKHEHLIWPSDSF